MKYKKLLALSALIIGLFFIPGICRAMPPGTLLYRTSGDGKMFGYSQDPLIYSEKGIIKDIYAGHVAIYIGKENGEDYIVEAMSGGIVKNPAKYFVNRADGETFLGARIPISVDPLQQARVVALAKGLVGKNLGYDFDFHVQKGPGSREWTCVGLTEKLYESANVFNPNNLGALEYDSAYYAVNITPDGYDKTSVVNSYGDCFSRSREFSKIARRKDLLIPAPELIGYDVGLEYGGDRYIFLPYTQFLQPTLKPVAADIEIASSFSRAEINGPMNFKLLVARWSLVNNPLSSLKIIGAAIKDAAEKTVAKTGELARGLSEKIFNSGSKTSISLVDDGLKALKSSTNVKKTVPTKKTAVAKKPVVGKTPEKTAAVKVTKKAPAPTVKSNFKPASDSAKTIGSQPAGYTQASGTAHIAAAVNSAVNPTVNSANLVSIGNLASGGSGGGNSAGTSAVAPDNFPRLAKINKIYSTGGNDWVEIINTTDHDFDLAAAGYRLEKTKTAEDPSLLMRIGDTDDGSYPGGTIIKAHGTYLIVNGGANDYYRQKADALVLRDGFDWPGSGYTLYLGTAAITSSIDPDIVDAVGFGAGASYFLGDGPAPEIKDNYVLRRVSSFDDNAADFNLISSDDPAIVWDIAPDDSAATSTQETATSTQETATSTQETATSTQETATSTDIDLGRLLLIGKIYSTGDNDWIELFNPTDNDFDLAAAGYRLEKAVSAQDPSLLMRFGEIVDGYYPGGTVIKAHDNYLIARDDANSYYLDQADAIATRTDFNWSGGDYSIYLGSEPISSSVDPDIVDLVGFGPGAYYYEGAGPAPEILDNYILNRLADTGNNSTDFNLIASDDPGAIVIAPTTNPDLFIPPTPIISEGLTDIWHFNECYGPGNWAVGKWDCAYRFGYYYEPWKVALGSPIDLNDGFSMSFYYNQTQSNAQVKAELANAEGEAFSLKIIDSFLEINGLPNSQSRYYGVVPAAGGWHKISLVINQAADYWEVYIDSQSVARESFMVRLPIMSSLEMTGASNPVLVDELAFWHRALAASEIKAEYEADAPYSPMPERVAQKEAELLHLWKFEEDTGTTATDNISGATLNVSAGAWVGRSHDNYAIKTLFGNNYSGTLANFPETKDMSMAFWWRDSSDPHNGQADIYLTGGTDNNKNLFALLADNFRLDYWFNGDYSVLAEGINKAIPSGSDWHYLTFVYDSYRYKLSFYVDGAEKASTSLIWMPDGEKITGIKIATTGYGAEIDDLGLWNGALSPSQVKEIYTNNK